MRIKNNISLGSIKRWLVLAIPLTLALFVWFWLMYMLFEMSGYGNFISWFFNAYKFTSTFVEILTIYAYPIVWLCFIITSIYIRHKKIVKFNKKLDLKYVDFLSDRVSFSFNQPQYNFTCGYKDIEALEMYLEHNAIITKSGNRIGLNDIKLSFTVLNKKNFCLTNRETRVNLKAIYAIIDAGRLVQKFSCKFGGGNLKEIKERVKAYKKYGLQPILTSEMKLWFKNFSILFFTGGLIYWYYLLFELGMKGIFLSIFIIPITALIISFVADVFLILEEVNENKHKGFL